jgi:hypothetical protein
MSAIRTSDWYDPAIYPERRDGAPWVMEDMIEAQAGLPEGLHGSLGEAAPRLVEMLRAATDAGAPVVVSGVGTSGHSARAVALILNNAIAGSVVAAGPVEARLSADQAHAPRQAVSASRSPTAGCPNRRYGRSRPRASRMPRRP